MYTHLKERSYYENLYDKHTVEDARRCIKYYEDFYKEFEEKLPRGDKLERPGNALLLNMFYMEVIGNELCRRYEERDQKIRDWMAQDEAKDHQLASARLAEEPYCQHCSKQGLRITDKQLMHRGEKYKYDDPEEVLFMLGCLSCGKTSAFWEDGSQFRAKPTKCPQCRSDMEHTTTIKDKVDTTTYTCPSCGHTYSEEFDFSPKTEEPDPDFEKDRYTFCLLDTKILEEHRDAKHRFEGLVQLGKELQEKEANKDVYDAIEALDKLKIAQLLERLSEILPKHGYTEFSLDKPHIGAQVTVGFNCLDSKADRDDYTSKNSLKRLINRTLENTNWRLVSDTISLRLGYLSGALRAYESEDDLKKLVEKKLKNSKVKRRKLKSDEPDSTDIKK